VPTLILWGDSDKIFPPAYGDAMQKLIPGSTLTIVPDCGHLPQQEKLDDFISAVTAFTAANTVAQKGAA
jgi:pimeloyl-ACP methyl ester carboxylesterase